MVGNNFIESGNISFFDRILIILKFFSKCSNNFSSLIFFIFFYSHWFSFKKQMWWSCNPFHNNRLNGKLNCNFNSFRNRVSLNLCKYRMGREIRNNRTTCLSPRVELNWLNRLLKDHKSQNRNTLPLRFLYSSCLGLLFSVVGRRPDRRREYSFMVFWLAKSSSAQLPFASLSEETTGTIALNGRATTKGGSHNAQLNWMTGKGQRQDRLQRTRPEQGHRGRLFYGPVIDCVRLAIWEIFWTQYLPKNQFTPERAWLDNFVLPQYLFALPRNLMLVKWLHSFNWVKKKKRNFIVL